MKIFFTGILVILQFQLFAALPLIDSYNHNSYNGGAENWDVVKSKNNFIYIANEKGVLQFDGLSWSIIRTPQIVRSLALVGDSILYVGCDNDIGTIDLKSDIRIYQSKKGWLKSKGVHYINEVWSVCFFENKLIAQTPRQLLIFEKDKLLKLPVNCFVRALYQVKGHVYLVDTEKGLMELVNNELQVVENGGFFKGDEVNSILPFNNGGLLISTWSKGFFQYDKGQVSSWGNDLLDEVWRSYVFRGVKSKGVFYFGTTKNGVYMVSEEGKVLNHINVNNGLKPNKVFNLYVDDQGSLWVTLENGVEHIAMNAPVSIIDQRIGLNGICYEASMVDERLFVGTSQGLFVGDEGVIGLFSDEKVIMKIYKNITGPVHFYEKWKGNYFYGHLRGLYAGKNSYKKIYSGRNCMDMLPLSKNSEYILVAFEDQLILVKYDGLEAKLVHEFDSLRGVENMILHKSDIWLNTRYEGVLKLRLDTLNPQLFTLTNYFDKGLKNQLSSNRVFKVKSQILCVTNAGVYEYEANSDKFLKSTEFNELGDCVVNYLYEDNRGVIWYQKGAFSSEELFMKYSSGMITRQGEINTKLKDEYFDFITQLNDSLIAFGGYDGLKILNLNLNPNSYSSRLFFNEIKLKSAKNEEVLVYDFEKNMFVGEFHSFAKDQIPPQFNQIQFSFGNTLMHDIENNEFSYKLEGVNEGWSDWNSKTRKSFSYLSAGEYVFRLKSQNAFGLESEELNFTFALKKPFYASSWFYFLGVLFFVLLVLSVVFMTIKRKNQKTNF